MWNYWNLKNWVFQFSSTEKVQIYKVLSFLFRFCHSIFNKSLVKSIIQLVLPWVSSSISRFMQPQICYNHRKESIKYDITVCCEFKFVKPLNLCKVWNLRTFKFEETLVFWPNYVLLIWINIALDSNTFI